MRTVPAGWADAIAAPHELRARVDVLRAGEVIAELDTVTAGNVTLDGAAASRGRADVTVSVDRDELELIPSRSTDTLAPYGNEFRVYRGIMLAGVEQLVSLGVFRIDSAPVTDAGGELTVRLSGLDRSARVIDARFTAARQVAAGTPAVDAIDALLAPVGFTIANADTTTYETPTVNAALGADRWATAQQIATAAGLELYFDGDGELCLRRPQAPSAGVSVAAIAEGDGGVLLNAARDWNREGAYNAVVATGEAATNTAPPYGIAVDDDPDSPTYYYGPFGQVPRFYSSPLLTTDAQCADAAASMLARELGTTQSISFGAVVNPALEPGDVVTITRERLDLDEYHALDQLTIPLTFDGAMTGKTRGTPAP